MLGVDACWEWLASKNSQGYGRFDSANAHRTAYEFRNGPIPVGMCVCHRCDNPPCCNPDLFQPAFVRAKFSPDMRYRYELRREVVPVSSSTGSALVREYMGRKFDSGSVALFCGANPSTADAEIDDQTIRKEIGFASRWGCTGLIKVNLFAFRSTDPDGVPKSFAGVGLPENVGAIDAALAESCVKFVVAAWGDCLAKQPSFADEVAGFRFLAEKHKRQVMCFGLTQNGQPRHPLMLPYSTALIPWTQGGPE